MTRTRAFAFATLLVLGGCKATTNPTSPGIEGVLFEDLPAAPGMTLEKPGYGHKSPSGSVREYDEHYSGSRKLEDTKAFYEKALPVHNWVLKGTEGSDPVTLTFEKKMEKVDVKIWTERGLLKVHVHTTGK